jgi:hypothetical protein
MPDRAGVWSGVGSTNCGHILNFTDRAAKTRR